jgi:hypothetical protein
MTRRRVPLSWVPLYWNSVGPPCCVSRKKACSGTRNEIKRPYNNEAWPRLVFVVAGARAERKGEDPAHEGLEV